MSSKTKPFIAAILLAVNLWPQVARAGAPQVPSTGIPITEVQRQLQARYFVIASNYIVWPPCPCGSPAPHYPPGGFYGDLDKNRAYAAFLVRNLATNFYSFFVDNVWLKTNSLEGIEVIPSYGFSPSPGYYTSTDFPSTVGGLDLLNANTNNYGPCLTNLVSYITQLKYFTGDVYAGQVDPDGNDTQYFYGTSGTSCDNAVASGNFEDWNTKVVITTNGGWSADSFDSVEFDYGSDPWIGYETSGYFDGVSYYAFSLTVRGAPAGYPSASGYTSGQITVYAQGGIYGDSVGAHSPPVTLDGDLHLLKSGRTTNGLPLFCDQVANFTPTISCGNDEGWTLNEFACVVAPDFDATPDGSSSSKPGCGCGNNSSVPGSCTAYTGCMDLQVSLGPDSNGQSAGYFFVEADTFSTNLYSPTTLQSALSGDDTPSLSGGFGTVTTANVTATIASSTNGYGIWFTNNLTADFVASVTVSSNAANQLTVTEIIGSTGSPRVMVFNYSPSTTNWTLSEGSGLRNESRSTVWTSPTNRTDTIVISNASSAIATQTTEVSQMFPWGLSLLQRTEGSGADAKTTVWNYYPASAAAGSYGQVASMVDSTGRWTWYQYDSAGRLTNEVTPLGDNLTTTNAGSNRQTETIFDDSNSGVTTIELLAGTEVGRTYEIDAEDTSTEVEEIQTITCTVAGAGIGDSSNLTNITWRTLVASGAMNAFDTMTNLNSDGTMSIYTYGNPTLPGWLTGRSVTVDTGAPGAGGTSIVDGTETTTTYGTWGELLTNQVSDIASGVVLSLDSYDYGSDPLHRSYTVTHNDGTTESVSYACCGLDTATDRDGVTTQYYYDDAKRQVATARLGIMTTNVLDAAGNTVQTIRIGTNGSPISLSGMAYDDSGTLVYETNALNGVTTHTQTTNSAGETIYTVTNPDGGTVVTTNYLDGMTGGVGGTSANWSRLVQGADGGGAFTYAIKVNASGGTNEWTKSYTDVGGRASGTAYPDGSYSTNYYNALGQMTKAVDQDGVTALYQYIPNGEQVFTAVGSDGSIALNGSDRLTYVTNDVTTDHSTGVRRSRTYVFPTVSSSTSNLVSMTETSTNGLTTWQTRYGPSTVTSQSATVYNGSYRTNTATAENGSSVVTVYLNGIRQSVTMLDANGSQVGKTTYTYDAQGRVTTETDARNGTTSYAYDNADQVDSVTTPPPAGSGSGLTTLTYYNAMLQPTNVVYPDSTSVTTVYTLTGQVVQTSGSRTYPVGYSYDAQGRMLTMTNWTGGVGSGAELTTWKYDGQRGWLTNKQDNSGYGPSYTYTAAGRLSSRTWARGTNTTYTYNAAGDLAAVGYNDGTQGLTNGYDRLGRRTSVFCGPIETLFGYDSANDYIGEGNIGGILNGLFVTNGYDSLLRRYNNSIVNSGTVIARTTNGYDAAGRVAVVSDRTNTATYNYVANSPLVDHIMFAHSGSAVMTNQNTYDYVNRLTGKTSALNFAYQYNAASQRTKVSLMDGSYWLYSYDALGQLTNGVKYFWDGTPYAGQQFGYNFDTIGNRTSTEAGGDASRANLRLTSYTNNALKQVVSRNVPGDVDVMGLSLATNTVTVNGTNAYQKWEYYREQMATNNTSAAQWVGITVSAPGQTTVTGGVFVAQTPETMTYDLDGNETQDGRFTNTWDAENRVTSFTSLASAPTPSKYNLACTYDYMSRRIQKIVSTNNGSSYGANYTNRFLYDGWNMVATLDGGNNLLYSYTWGTDLSGSMQGAGGVGGLISMTVYAGPNAGTYFYCYDGNANIVALVNASTGAVAATYEYNPFLEVIRATGPMAKINPFLGSTKYYDWETGFYYYGRRYYNPSTGRWLSRDPLTEPGFNLLTTGHQASENSSLSDGDGDSPNLNDFLTAGGPNAYAFVDNDPVNQIDGLGLVIVGFYGADTWFTFPVPGNTEMKRIADAVGAPIYRSLDIWDPYQYILTHAGCNDPIKIFGWSWGGISAVKLSRWIGRSALRNHEIDVYTIDPVSKLRLPPTSVPSSVTYFWNRYETHGGPVLGGIKIHGRRLTSYAKSSDQQDLNPGPVDNGIDHVQIVFTVANELIGKLKQ